ncbi:hypothetical protein ETAA8_47500 [Anatilimnocola aggregata]|uniref:Uncharacterized protein n=1 Tax=Anatilimnocola aggregata TaxID=2528021 RepID=A0A517YHF7_9BACT|nr:hypothetical protein [Anatilimnocola aggregata]QDU29635.1 hypothetical protein ETAA8_47500 [Anatilimnocola aggregata]
MTEPLETNSNSESVETEAAREARFRRAIDEAMQLAFDGEFAVASPPRYSLRELMLVTTLLAVMLGLIRAFGLWGATITFVASLVWTNVYYPHRTEGNHRRQAFMFDLVWGLLMPIVCLVCDPFVFKDQRELVEQAFNFSRVLPFQPNLRQESIAAYCCIGWQMLLLIVWLLARRWLTKVAGFFLGSWIVGIIIAGVLGVLLAPIALVGSIVGVGLLAFTPLLTTYVAARRMREAIDDGILDSSENSVTIFWLLASFGFISSWLIPFQLAILLKRAMGG